MAVVPIRKGSARAASPPPPQTDFALMAAAQMHSEGRLVSSGSSAAIASTQPAPSLT